MQNHRPTPINVINYNCSPSAANLATLIYVYQAPLVGLRLDVINTGCASLHPSVCYSPLKMEFIKTFGVSYLASVSDPAKCLIHREIQRTPPRLVQNMLLLCRPPSVYPSVSSSPSAAKRRYDLLQNYRLHFTFGCGGILQRQ